MNVSARITVVGSSPFALAMAGEIARKGGRVSLVETAATPLLNHFFEIKKINITGVVDESATLEYVGTDQEAITNAQVIILSLQPENCEDTMEQMIPCLKSGQHIVVFPGNFCATIIRKLLQDHAINDITVSESASIPFVFDKVDFNTIKIHRNKEELKIATCPAEKRTEVLDILNRYIEIFVPAANIIETSLENINSILHPLPILLNIAELERKGKDFYHFIDGVTPLVSTLLEKMDRERMAIGQAYELNLIPTLEQLKGYYGGNDCQTIYDYIQTPECPYDDIKGFDLSSRYITVDIPYLLVPASCLAKAADIKTPIFDLCIALASQLHDIDYFSVGYNLERLGFANKTKKEILKTVCTF